MDAVKQRPARASASTERARRYRDLRAHNERHAQLAREIDAERKTRIERVLQAARQRRKIDFI
jgi:hypothetical protein